MYTPGLFVYLQLHIDIKKETMSVYFLRASVCVFVCVCVCKRERERERERERNHEKYFGKEKSVLSDEFQK